MKTSQLILGAALAATLGAASLSASAAASILIGESAPVSSAQRTVVIDSNTKWVNVTQDEVVKFVVNGREFAWDFDGLPQRIDLATIAPAGTLDHPVLAYVAPSPDRVPDGD